MRANDLAESERKIREGLDRLLESGRMKEDIARYMNPRNSYARDVYNGLGRNDPSSVGADDLLAVTLLDLSTPVGLVEQALSPPDGSGCIDKFLLDLPTDRDLWDADDSHLDVANTAFEQLRTIDGVGPTRANKLLARKRPRLVPVWDDVVHTYFGEPKDFWLGLSVVQDNEQLRHALWDQRPASWPADMSLLRLIDIAVWMAKR